jgi:hypothetical protein
MKYGDEYFHFKGSIYMFITIALPVKETNIDTWDRIVHGGTHHETLETVTLYYSNGATYTPLDVPCVLYINPKDPDNTIWVREVDDFFGCKEVDGEHVKRFTLLEKGEERI